MFLDEAVRAVKEETRRRMEECPPERLEEIISVAGEPMDFKESITRGDGRIRLIAEVKRSSPSAGEIRKDASVADITGSYCAAGASAVSVLTCEYRFGGSIEDLADACRVATVPVLRKDFITEPYQVLEARAVGASAVLLIAAALGESGIRRLMGMSLELGMTPLVEAHGREDLEAALDAGAEVLGINNRDLNTLEVDLGTTEMLRGLIPEGAVVVSESGISCRGDVRMMEELGVDALLIGEVLMRAEDHGRRIMELMGEVDESCG